MKKENTKILLFLILLSAIIFVLDYVVEGIPFFLILIVLIICSYHIQFKLKLSIFLKCIITSLFLGLYDIIIRLVLSKPYQFEHGGLAWLVIFEGITALIIFFIIVFSCIKHDFKKLYLIYLANLILPVYCFAHFSLFSYLGTIWEEDPNKTYNNLDFKNDCIYTISFPEKTFFINKGTFSIKKGVVFKPVLIDRTSFISKRIYNERHFIIYIPILFENIPFEEYSKFKYEINPNIIMFPKFYKGIKSINTYLLKESTILTEGQKFQLYLDLDSNYVIEGKLKKH